MKKKKIKENISIQDAEREMIKATVVKIMNKQAQVRAGDKLLTCLLPQTMVSKKNALVVGDRVAISSVDNDTYRLSEVLPRETEVFRGSRRSPGERILIAANVHYLLAVATAEYFRHQAGYLESAVIAARRAGVKIIILISKWDLVGKKERELLEKKINLYRKTADLVFAGAKQAEIEAMIEEVSNKTGVVVGDRSCGKSTLIHKILSRLSEEVKTPVKFPSTHSSQMMYGPQNTCLIDTPGFRDFALQAVAENEKNTTFPEIARMVHHCAFSSCTHTHEEGCAVLQALREESVERERYDAYQSMGEKPSKLQQKPDYRRTSCTESFVCKVCGAHVAPEGAGSEHRNHCPKCLSSLHVDKKPGDRASLCHGVMEPVSVWVRKNGEWAVIHRCRLCGALSSNRIAADDNPALLMSIAVKPLARTPFPLNKLEEVFGGKCEP